MIVDDVGDVEEMNKNKIVRSIISTSCLGFVDLRGLLTDGT